MEVNATLLGFLLGVAGGALVELLGWFHLRNSAKGAIKRPTAFYCIVTGLMVLAGGGVVLVHQISGMELEPILMLNVGASAPLILSTVARQIPAQQPAVSGAPESGQ